MKCHDNIWDIGHLHTKDWCEQITPLQCHLNEPSNLGHGRSCGEAVAKLCFFVGLKITFNYLKSFLALQKCTASPGWGHFETNPKILESLEGPEGYLCPGIHILGIISVYGKPFYTSG